ncbi:MAG: sugar transferase [Desulfatitalea sp.]|nr:sugar transferase [Desulfatitalea sp.]
MFDEKSIEVGRITFLIDVILTTTAFFLAFFLRNLIVSGEMADIYSHAALLPLLLTFIIGFLSYFGAYRGPRHMTIMGYIWVVFRSLALGVGAMLTILFVMKIQYVSRTIILFFTGIEFLFIVAVRIGVMLYFKQAIKKGGNSLRVIIIGTGERAKELSITLRKQAEWGIEILGYLDPDIHRVGTYIMNAPVIGTLDDISKCLKNSVVDEVIIAITRSMIEDAEYIAHVCEEEGIKLRFMADVFSLQAARIRLIQAGHIPLLTMEPVAQDEIQLMIKRFIDLTVTLLSMPIVLPLIGLTAIAIKFDSPGQAFFIQNRVGLKKRVFPLIKFRSMFQDAEARLKEIEHLNEAEGPIFKMKNDPRVTRVGRIIRKTSLDELPQLFNVIMGHMSLVGPRPMSLRDVDLFDKGIQRKRFSVKPGITCLWQISGRSNLPFSKWLELDLEYIEGWTLFLDLVILVKTIPAVLRGSGAV